MNELVTKIFSIMEGIEYGFKDENGINLYNDKTKWDNDFKNFYYLLTPEETYLRKCGTCFDQVELERKLFNEAGIPAKTYFICTYDGENIPSHSFLVYEENENYYWFEHSWSEYKGVHKYNDLKELVIDVKEKFIRSHLNELESTDFTFVHEFKRPEEHISCDEYYAYMETQKLLRLNEPLYFYHVVSKGANMSNGLISLRYMYEHNLNDLFDINASKYIDRITGAWELEKYKGRKDLSRKEICEALREFRGPEGDNYIYFFKYPLYEELGDKINELLKHKDIYRININDEYVMKHISDIFYGYNMSHSDQELLNKTYYENISESEYFKNYDDSLEMNFSTLNHISIAFKDGHCPLEFLERVSN